MTDLLNYYALFPISLNEYMSFYTEDAFIISGDAFNIGRLSSYTINGYYSNKFNFLFYNLLTLISYFYFKLAYR